MKQWHWFGLGILALTLAVVYAAMPQLGGGNREANAADGITVALDMDITDGGPCADIDSSTSHTAGEIYDVAICVQGLSAPIGVATVHVIYDDTLNTATEVPNSGKGLDDNPDANAGTTTWGDGLGTNFDCSGGGSAFPMGDKNPSQSGPGKGDAFISCMDVIQGPWTLGDNETSGVIAVIEFTATHEGTDTLTINNGLLGDTVSSEMGSCNPSFDYPMTCNGGEDDKTGGGAAPTSTGQPTATATRSCGGAGQPACPTSTPTSRALTSTPASTATGTPEATPPPPAPPPPLPPSGGGQPAVMPPTTGEGAGSGSPWAATVLMSIAALGISLTGAGAGMIIRRVRAR